MFIMDSWCNNFDIHLCFLFKISLVNLKVRLKCSVFLCIIGKPNLSEFCILFILLSVGSPAFLSHFLIQCLYKKVDPNWAVIGIQENLKVTYTMWNIQLEYCLLCFAESLLETENRDSYPLWGAFNTMVSLKICLSSKLQKLQNRHFHTSRTPWGYVCETSFISLYHQDIRCQAEIPCW